MPFVKLGGYLMSAGTKFSFVPILEQLLHAFTIRLQYIPITCFGMRIFRKPPYTIYGILDPLPANCNPFRWGRKFRGVVPKKFLCKKKLISRHLAEFYQ